MQIGDGGFTIDKYTTTISGTPSNNNRSDDTTNIFKADDSECLYKGDDVLTSSNWSSYITIPEPMSTEEITQSNLKTKINQSKLEIGKFYRITDYTCYVESSLSYMCQSAGHQFDLIFQAIAKNKLSPNGMAVIHANDTYFSNCDLHSWEIRGGFPSYKSYTDFKFFEWCDNNHICIWYMKDEFGNEAPYDFKNIQFKRYKNNKSSVTSGSWRNKYYYILDGSNNVVSPQYTDNFQWEVDTTSSTWFYTFDFGSISGTTHEDATIKVGQKNPCRNNIIKPCLYFDTRSSSSYASMRRYTLPNIVITGASSYSNINNFKFGENCSNITIDTYSAYSYVPTGVSSAVFGDGNSDIILQSSNAKTTIGNNNSHLLLYMLGSNQSYNDFVIGNGNYNINFKADEKLKIGNSVHDFRLNDYVSSAYTTIIGDGVNNIDMTNGKFRNIIFDELVSNIRVYSGGYTETTECRNIHFTSSCAFTSMKYTGSWYGRDYWTIVKSSTAVDQTL